MSHRAIDERVELRVWIDVIDDEIAAAKRVPVVDLVAITAMRRRRAEMAAYLAHLQEVQR